MRTPGQKRRAGEWAEVREEGVIDGGITEVYRENETDRRMKGM